VLSQGRLLKKIDIVLQFSLIQDILYSISIWREREEFFMAETRTISVNRWGNGLGIRLPKEFTDKEGITETSKVEVSATDSGLIITRAKEPRRHIPLAERLKNWDGQPYEITDEDKEWLNMEPVGDEIW
jgi:antitoxin component of MazEF toxin-antitoxin module